MTTDIELYWPEGPVSPELESLVAQDIRRELLDKKTGSGLKKAEDLLFHMVTLSSVEEEGPCVIVSGVKGDARFHCRFEQKQPEGMRFHIDDIPGMREKLKAAGWKDPTDEEDNET